MLDVISRILKCVYWIVNTSGLVAATFTFASLTGMAVGRIKAKHPNILLSDDTLYAETILWLIGLTIVFSIPALNWFVAYVLYDKDTQFVDKVTERIEQHYNLDSCKGETLDTQRIH